MRYRVLQAGFTLVELLVVLAIIGIISLISMAGIRTYSERQAFTDFSSDIKALTAAAQRQAVAAQGGSSFGVYFSSNTIEQFTGDTVIVGASNNTVVTVPSYVRVVNNLPGGVQAVVFAKHTGTPSVTGTIELVDDRTVSTSTITFGTSNLVE